MSPTPSPRGSEELTVRTNITPPRTPRSALDAIEGTAPPSSARAVLEALRALQRKITRLETERSGALSEATEVRSRLESQSAASVRASELQSRQLEDLERSFQLRESRLVRDRDDLTRRLDDAERDKLEVLRECAGLRDRADALRARLARAEARADAAVARSPPGAGRSDALEARLASATERAVAAELRVEDLESDLRAAREPAAAAALPPPPPPPPPPSPPPPPRLRLAEPAKRVAKPKRAAARPRVPGAAAAKPRVAAKLKSATAGPAAATARLRAARPKTGTVGRATTRLKSTATKVVRAAAPNTARAATAAPKRTTDAATGRAAAVARLKATAKKVAAGSGPPKPVSHPYLGATRPRRPTTAPARAPRPAAAPARAPRLKAAPARAPRHTAPPDSPMNPADARGDTPLVDALREAVQAADDPAHVSTLRDILARVQSGEGVPV